jgi:hypothetical protein
VLRRLFLIPAVLGALALAIRLTGWFPFAWPEKDGLLLRLCHQLPEYRILDARQYWHAFGFAFGKGWLGGMQAGEGDFMIRYWWLQVPYWFCGIAAGVVCTLVLMRVRSLVRRRTTTRPA